MQRRREAQPVLVTKDGDLLMVGAGRWVRVPRAGSARASVLQEALRRMKTREGVKIGLAPT